MGSRVAAPSGEAAFTALHLLRNYFAPASDRKYVGLAPGTSLVPGVYHPGVDRDWPHVFGAFHPYLPAPAPAPVLASTDSKGRFLLTTRRPRGEKKPIPEEQKDDRYYERRKRNNQAAKKSRDARKLREDQIALRAALLEHENAVLRAQIATLREETQSLRQLLLVQGKTLPSGRGEEFRLPGLPGSPEDKSGSD